MKNTLKFVLICNLTLMGVLFADFFNDISEWQSDNVINKPTLKVDLKFTKRKYALNEPILAEVTIINIRESGAPVRFNIEKNYYNHFTFELQDENDRTVDNTIKYLAWQHRSRKNPGEADAGDGNHKRVELAYQDSYRTTIDIREWFSIKESGFYFIEGFFLPNFAFDQNEFSFRMEPESFHIVNDYYMEKKADKIVEEASADIQGFFPPYEVIDSLIKAEINENWPRFYSLIDLKKFLANSYSTIEIYERFKDARAEEKNIILEDFKNFLKKSIDYNIKRYEVIDSYIQQNVADVKVRMETVSASQQYIKKFNPLTGQLEFNWEEGKQKDFFENRVVYYRLLKTGNDWKVTHKEVSIHSSFDETGLVKSPFRNEKKPIYIDNILFDRGRYYLKPAAVQTLDKIIKLMGNNPDLKLEIRGHTDNVGNSLANMILSKNRAMTAEMYLVRKGIKKDRIYHKWYGKNQPLNNNSDEAKRARNRRVEFAIIEK